VNGFIISKVYDLRSELVEVKPMIALLKELSVKAIEGVALVALCFVALPFVALIAIAVMCSDGIAI